MVAPPGVVTGRYGTIGEIFFIEEPFWPLNTTLYARDFHSNDERFVYYLLHRFDFATYSGKSGVPGVNRNDLHGEPVALPIDLNEQRAIAQALSDVDALLAGLDRLIAKKRDLKQAAMQQLLSGRRRLPQLGAPDAKWKKTEMGPIPEDWRLARLVDLVDPSRAIRYGIVQPGEYDPQGRYMIRGQDYSQAKGWAKPTEVFRVSPAIEGRYANARVKAGDLIMTIVGYCGHVETVPQWLDGANLTQTTARVSIRSDIAVSEYVMYALRGAIGQRQVAAYLKGAAQPGLNCGDVEQFLVPLPSKAEQTAIARVLQNMDSEIQKLDERITKTDELKQAMMQELLTGRIRLI